MLGCSDRTEPQASSSAGKTIRSYQVEQVPVEPDPGYTLSPGETAESWQTYVTFPDLGARVALERTEVTHHNRPGSSYTDEYGLDTGSVKVQWLDVGRLLWIRWSDIPQGSGCFTSDGHVILEVSDGEFRELFRDHHGSHGRSGWSGWGSADLGIRWDRGTRRIIMTKTVRSWYADDEKRIPLSTWRAVPNYHTTAYVRDVTTREVRRYEIRDGRLHGGDGYRVAELGEGEYPLSEVADYFESDVATLRRNSPRLRDVDRCSGTVVLAASLAPHVMRTYEQASDISGDSYEDGVLVQDGAFLRYAPRSPVAGTSRDPRPYKVVHVFVALCDNKYQGIVPVPAKLGNGQDPHNNLYWGAMYGVKTFFKNSPHWTPRELPEKRTPAADEMDDRATLDECVFKSVGLTPPVYVVARAWNGRYIKNCIGRFLHAAAGQMNADVLVNDSGNALRIDAGGASDMVCFIGHNGFMDGQIFGFPEGAMQPNPECAVVLACKSHESFASHLKLLKCPPLITTTGLMAPEAYTLDAIIRSWAKGQPPARVRKAAAAAYAKYQRISQTAAERLFAAASESGR